MNNVYLWCKSEDFYLYNESLKKTEQLITYSKSICANDINIEN